MSSEPGAKFVPMGNYSLDEWGPRRRGEWPGPNITIPVPEWRFPEGYPIKQQRVLDKKYWHRMNDLKSELKPQLPEDQESRVLAERDNARRQEAMFLVGFEFCKEWIERVGTSLDHIQYRDFCWKLCAIYMASADDVRPKQIFGGPLYNYLDSICFKGEQTWAFCDSFLAKVIYCSPEEAQDLPDLISSHGKLCNKVSNNWCLCCEPLSAEECREKEMLCTEWRPEDHLILPIFQRLFIIIDEIPTDGPPNYEPDFRKAKGRLVFTQDQTATDSINVPDLCTKYSNINSTDNPNVAIGEFGTLVEVVMSLWEQERPRLTYLDSIVDKLQERMKFKVRDNQIERQRLFTLSASREAEAA